MGAFYFTNQKNEVVGEGHCPNGWESKQSVPEGCSLHLGSVPEGAAYPPLPEETYAAKRYKSYPNFRLYLDGQAKLGSDDPQIVADGQAQIQEYRELCLAVKKKYPKEV